MRIGRGSKLLLIGDSITDCGRRQPVGEGPGDGLGNGYVGQLNAVLTAFRPDLRIRVVNMGISGNTVRSLRDRWRRDVLDLSPDWLSIMIGINDVWRHFDQPLLRENHVGLDEYEGTLRELVAQTRPGLKGLVLMTPYYIEPQAGDPMRAMMDQYGAVVREVAAEHDAVFVGTQSAFDAVTAHVYPGSLAGDRVHPNASGHMVITRAFLDAVGFEWRGAAG